MAVHKTIEIMGESEKSWEDAVENVVRAASKSVDDVRSVWIKDHSVRVKDGKITSYRANCKVTFKVKS
jgi:flavin-binding protein dodecin